MIGTLEEIAMPQNGIYHVGISALSEAFTYNRNLQILNLNDNTIGPKGAEAIAKALPNLQNLKEINFGDCLLKTKGSILLANGLKNAHVNLRELILGFNEIKKEGALQLAGAMANKVSLVNVALDGNQLGQEGKEELKRKFREIGKFNVLGSLEEDESDDDEEEEDESEGSDEENEESQEEDGVEITEIISSPNDTVTIQEFLATPSAQNFMALGGNRTDILIKEAKKNGDISIDNFIPVLMKVASLSNNTDSEVAETSLKCTELLFKDLFIWSQLTDKTSVVNNTILVNLGLIKSEDKKYKPTWNFESCLHALNNIITKNYVPESTKDTLKVFMQRQV
ncbi:hypothetical protein NQ314_019797 [Rhamnusium bicolor]|uniref:Ran-GTPase activating protein 1 C-terminal domain-containing protein n=1 Tax=Rhamnusium bicolor TaxID=1586634 RepID=A0AAV8WMM8_9CUCU|nr:hypothetical protein NQ314_019797 [Rhamnusium bicolor]